jgi:hypothetical protein
LTKRRTSYNGVFKRGRFYRSLEGETAVVQVSGFAREPLEPGISHLVKGRYIFPSIKRGQAWWVWRDTGYEELSTEEALIYKLSE